MAEFDPKGGGWLTSFRRLGESLLALAQGRLELFSLELQSERLRLLDALIRLLIAGAVGVAGVLLATAVLAIYAWNVGRYGGLIVLSALYLGTAGVLIWRLREGLRNAPPPFPETVAEFKKDRECLPPRE
jgi:uncharacterized membrane protein YqjE